jgi:hypothetical protein
MVHGKPALRLAMTCNGSRPPLPAVLQVVVAQRHVRRQHGAVHLW